MAKRYLASIYKELLSELNSVQDKDWSSYIESWLVCFLMNRTMQQSYYIESAEDIISNKLKDLSNTELRELYLYTLSILPAYVRERDNKINRWQFLFREVIEHLIKSHPGKVLCDFSCTIPDRLLQYDELQFHSRDKRNKQTSIEINSGFISSIRAAEEILETMSPNSALISYRERLRDSNYESLLFSLSSGFAEKFRISIIEKENWLLEVIEKRTEHEENGT